MNQASVSTTNLKTIEIPLPPLEEQRRIAAILDAADRLRTKRRQALAKLDTLTQAIFIDMFGDPKLTGEDRLPLGSILKVKSGHGLVKKDMVAGGKYAVYGGNGINGAHDEYMFDERKVAIGRVGVYCGCVHYTEPQSWITDNALYVHELSVELSPEYLVTALTMANLNQYADQAAQPLISGKKIYPIEIPVPAIEEQVKFERASEEVRHAANRLERHENELNTLFASLQQRAFRGEL